MPFRSVIIDDEELARAHLRMMLVDNGLEVVAEGETGINAIDLAERFQPDVLFLDIQMPDMTGMQAAAALQNLDKAPKIVFVTGYSKYAVEAFDREAFDYLIKPAEPERLRLTLNRLSQSQERAESQSAPEEQQASDLTPLQRLPVRSDYSIRLLKIEQIECAVSRERKVYVRSAGVEHRTYYTLTQLETLLPKAEFMRIHASALVRLELIESVNFLGNHTYSVTLAGGMVLPVGRTIYPDLQVRLGIS